MNLPRPTTFIAGAALIGAAACANVLSIEDAKVDPTFHPGSGSSTGASGADLCVNYCDTVMKNCTGVFAVYETTFTCLSLCPHLPVGAPSDTSGDSLYCRTHNAEQAPSEPSFYCPAAGPGGNGVCGTNCDALCTLAATICDGSLSPFTSDADCRGDCAALSDLGTYSTDPSKDMYEGSSVECRLFHVSAASVADPSVHCTHVGGKPPCVPDMSTGSGS